MFWDTSALLPLLLNEPGTPRMRALARGYPHIVAWWGTYVECRSAIARRVREGMPAPEARGTIATLNGLRGSWSTILPTDEVQGHATRLLDRHPLRAADALQLGAAMAWADARPNGHLFATMDGRLALAAHAEGFTTPLSG